MSREVTDALREILDKNYDEIFQTYDFDGWNEAKKPLERKNETPNFQSRQVWWCSLGVNLGFEQDEKNERFERPVLILHKFNRELFYGVPLSSQIKNGKFYYDLPDWNQQKGQVLLSQMRVMSAKRLLRYMYRLTPSVVDEIRNSIFTLPEKAKSPPGAGKSRRTIVRLRPSYSKPKAKSQPRIGVAKTKRSQAKIPKGAKK